MGELTRSQREKDWGVSYAEEERAWGLKGLFGNDRKKEGADWANWECKTQEKRVDAKYPSAHTDRGMMEEGEEQKPALSVVGSRMAVPSRT